MILHNPKNGAEIKNVWYQGELFFDEKDNATFKPGMVLQFEDEVGNFMLNLFGFLDQVTPDQAKEIIDHQNDPYKCEQCDFTTDTPIALKGHMRSHGPKLDDLGIPTVTRSHTIERNREDVDHQEAWDAQDKKEGLEGEGLIDEKIRRGVVMQ